MRHPEQTGRDRERIVQHLRNERGAVSDPGGVGSAELGHHRGDRLIGIGQQLAGCLPGKAKRILLGAQITAAVGGFTGNVRGERFHPLEFHRSGRAGSLVNELETTADGRAG